MKQQFLTLRDEIRESKARIFWLLMIGIVLIMVAGYLAAGLAGGAVRRLARTEP